LPYQSSVFVFINRILLTLQIKYYCKKLNMHSPIFWTFLPNTASFIHNFKEILSIYYITDDFTKFDGHPSVAIGAMEKRLIDSCDLIIASAKKLASIKQRGGKKIHVVSHGVNHAHFAKALTVRPEQFPVDISKISHPILGFYGELNSWIDVGMIVEAARKRPEWSFVLIGREAVELGNINYLNAIPNIHRLGKKKFDELPFYCAAFDVALIPMKLNELTVCVNPLKLREYLASGLPVISTPLPEIEPYSDVVEFARTPDELIMAFEKIRDSQSRWNKYNLSKRVVNETWAQKVEEISSLVMSGLKKKFPDSE
jgi:glycosyltransferase involved in cell wall biosynthesis